MRILIVLLTVGMGFFYKKNPLLFGQRTDMPYGNFEIIEHDPVLDDELFGLSSTLRPDFKAYRGHCLRVLTFTKYFLPDSVEKEIPNAMEMASVALAYHDLGLWSDKKLSYLEPSVARFETELAGSNYSETEMAIMKDIILQHHKVTSFESNRGTAADALVNAVRKADWADATMGIVRFNMPATLLEAAYDKIPEAGFHMLLAKFPPKLSPGNFLGMFDILKIFKW